MGAGNIDAPDIYAVESSYVLRYTKGDMSDYAAPYKDLTGKDVEQAVKDAQIADYNVEIGRNKNNDIVGIAYQATGGAFIYRRSFAKDVWGTDDPDAIQGKIGGGSGSWDQYWKAADELKAKGYAINAGDSDMWHAIENSSDSGWIVDGKLNIDPKREAFLDVSKKLSDNEYTAEIDEWSFEWQQSMRDEYEKKVFGYFGPAWLINFALQENCGGSKAGEGTYGDWAVTEAPIGFFWGGTWVLGSKNSAKYGKDKAVGELINYITLDATTDGLQYKWANGTFYADGGTKDTVASGVVMAMADGTLDFLSGQNMFDVFVPANKFAKGDNITQYDDLINNYWREAAREYAKGTITREEAITQFKENVKYDLGEVITVE